MAGKKDNRYEGMSASKAKRERAKDEREALKRSAKRTRAILIAIPVLIIAQESRSPLPRPYDRSLSLS